MFFMEINNIFIVFTELSLLVSTPFRNIVQYSATPSQPDCLLTGPSISILYSNHSIFGSPVIEIV